MAKSKAIRRPPIHMIDTEADALTNLAMNAEDRMPEVSELLLNEIGRAKIRTRDTIPPDVVTMHSVVEFVDQTSGADRTIVLVYPGEADISAGRVSILTPIGAGLIGLRTGQSILWPDRDGRERELMIVEVKQKAASD